jgi:hypothetical protein
MRITILSDGKIVGVYDEKTKSIETKEPELQKLVEDGCTALRPGEPEEDDSEEIFVKVKPDAPDFFFALLDEVWALGFDVASDVYEELERRC